MKTSRSPRAEGVIGHLLLVAALVFGIFVMHTLGHPVGASGSQPPAAHASACGTMPQQAGHPSGTGTWHADSPAQHGPEAAPGGTSDTTVADCPGTHTGMDMTTVCLAVLTTWALAVFLHVVISARRRRPVRPVTAALDVLRPNPPPRPPDLATLSILRI
jgi:hypothetical protein